MSGSNLVGRTIKNSCHIKTQTSHIYNCIKFIFQKKFRLIIGPIIDQFKLLDQYNQQLVDNRFLQVIQRILWPNYWQFSKFEIKMIRFNRNQYSNLNWSIIENLIDINISLWLIITVLHSKLKNLKYCLTSTKNSMVQKQIVFLFDLLEEIIEIILLYVSYPYIKLCLCVSKQFNRLLQNDSFGKRNCA